MISCMKAFCLMAVLTASSVCGTKLQAAEPESDFRIVYHDDYGNIITRVKPSSGYAFDSDVPYFKVDLPYKNTAWCDTQVSLGNTPPAGATIYSDGSTLSGALSSDLHLYPVISFGKFINFDSDGGTPVSFQFIYAGQKPTKPSPDPVKTGYTFAGWYDGDTQYLFNQPVTDPDINDPSTHRILLKAKWTANTDVEYKIHVWLEKAEHPIRTDLSDAQAHAFDDYDYGTTITKTGTSGGTVSFTSADMASNDIKDLTYFKNDRSKFPVYFYDNANGSFAQAMSEASISAMTVDPTGAATVNVFYRRIVFTPTIGVLTYTWDGWSFPTLSWDTRYEHPTVIMRNGERLGSALQRAIDGGTISLSEGTVTMFKTDTSDPDCDYIGYEYTTAYNNVECGWNDVYDEGLWERSVTAEDMYEIQNYNAAWNETDYSVNDGFNLYVLMLLYPESGYEFRKYYYTQTLDAALANSTDVLTDKAIANPAANYSLYDSFIGLWNDASTRYIEGDDEGFSLYKVQEVKRDGDGTINTVSFANNGKEGWFNNYTTTGLQLEIFLKRQSYTVNFHTGTSKVSVRSNSKFSKVFYEEPLSNIESLIVTTSGEAFAVDNTSYTSDNKKVYVFKGWYDNAECAGNPVDLSTMTMPSHNLQLYAKWEEKIVTVTFDGNGGLIDGATSYDLSVKSGERPKMEIMPVSPFPGRVVFGGWWTMNGKIYDISEPVYENIGLKAMYYSAPDIPFIIFYEPGDGTGDEVLEFEDYGYLFNANASIQPFFTDWKAPEGKVFKHWTDGTNTYEPGDELIVRDDVFLTAVYESGNANIVISREGLSAGESAIYTVYRGIGSEKTAVMNVVLIGTTSGTPTKVSRTLVDMEPGTYTVEETGWNWAYDKGTTTIKKGDDEKTSDTNGVGSGTISYNETLEFIFTGSAKTEGVRHSEKSKTNMLNASND